MNKTLFFSLCLFFSILTSHYSQELNSFYIGASGGYTWTSFTSSEFAADFDDYGEHHQYEFNNSYVASITTGYHLTDKIALDVKVTYLPGFTATYEERDQNDDVLLGDYDIKYFSAATGINYVVQSTEDYSILVGGRGGIIFEQKDINFSFRANMEIHESHRQESTSQNAFCGEIYLGFKKNLSNNIYLTTTLLHKRILSDQPKTKFTVFEIGVLYEF